MLSLRRTKALCVAAFMVGSVLTLNGITATKLIKDQYPEAKIIIVTNFDEDDLRESALQAGACGYVLKENLFEARRMLQEK